MNDIYWWIINLSITLLVIIWIIKLFKYFFWNKNFIFKKNNDYELNRFFFTINERIFYNNLKNILFIRYWNRYIIMSKVRLADIFNSKIWKYGLYKLLPKHIDFIILDSEDYYKPILWIELNWYSHYNYIQEKSDKFKYKLFKQCNIPLLYFYNYDKMNTEKIFDELWKYLK